MMVMFLAGLFVKRPQFRGADLYQPAVLYQKLQVSINSCLIERTDRLAARFEYFLDTQGPVYPLENFLYGVSLIGFSLHYGSPCHPSPREPLLQECLQ